ncbi:MAG: plasmid pRiA4b ORF-3 family protein [Cytophagaceae bacterium]|nr:plasmid pRiA4b ORF-3 family protein [Cytophagaceae bacterium]
MAHTLKITLAHTEPVIYRTVTVPENFTFHQLHLVIQIVMGWEDYHMYQFNLGSPYRSDSIKLPSEEPEDLWGPKYNEYDSLETFIKDVFNHSRKTINYLYDFGDDWLHTIKPLAKPKEEVLFPVCIEGAGATPVEDCGGIGGFYHMLEILNSPKNSSEKREMKEWLGMKSGDSYEKLFGYKIDQINGDLKKIFT